MATPAATGSFTLETLLTYGAAFFAALSALPLLFPRSKEQKLSDLMEDTPTTPVGQIDSVGFFEARGEIVCDQPLGHERCEGDLAFYRYVVREEWTDHMKGMEPLRKEEVLLDETHFAPFRIRDPSGEIAVDPEGARLEVTRLTHFVEYPESGESGLAMAHRMRGRASERERLERSRGHREEAGEVGIDLGVALEERGAVRTNRTEVSRVHELHGALVGDPLYVLGPTAESMGGGIQFARDLGDDQEYVLSTRDEEALGQQLRSQDRGTRGCILVPLALCLFLASLLMILDRQTLTRPHFYQVVSPDQMQSP